MNVFATADVRTGEERHAPDVTTNVLTRLLHAAGRVTAQQGRQLRAVGLSPSAFAVLAELDTTAGKGLQPCALAGLLSVTRPSVCGLIDGLEAKGLVSRAPHRHDGRRVVVRLTPQGSDLVAGHRSRYEHDQRALLGDLSDTERRQLAGLLDRVGT